ncbi:MAG: haloacid dehalogenase type II [Gammaproteobacteria bacterium]|nr:haloacid dehalogenase type II [Gammaproteobacteria bacterium]
METLALDVYGTLIDPHAIAARLADHLGDGAAVFSQIWRGKQLEFSFRRGLMGDYADFSEVTREALDYTDSALEADLSEAAKADLLDRYTRLDAYADVPAALAALRAEGRALFAFSNGHPAALESLLQHAGIAHLLDGVVSVHEVRSFKPDPRVYAHFLQRANSRPEQTRLVSSNAFDILGAQACGWQTAWIRRDARTVFDGWGPEPETILASLAGLIE